MSPPPARDRLAEQTGTPTHLGLWPRPGTTEPSHPTAGTHGATHEIDCVAWRYQGHQIDVNYLNDEPDHLFGPEVIVTAFVKDEGREPGLFRSAPLVGEGLPCPQHPFRLPTALLGHR